MNCVNEMTMKKWSSQWTQFIQLRKEAWKKIQDFNGVWTRDLAIYRCDALPTELWSHWCSEQVNCGFFTYFFFQASLRNCINCVHCDDHFFIVISFTQFIYDLFHISLTLLGLVASVCTPLPTRTQKLPTLLAQQCWKSFRQFALS